MEIIFININLLIIKNFYSRYGFKIDAPSFVGMKEVLLLIEASLLTEK